LGVVKFHSPPGSETEDVGVNVEPDGFAVVTVPAFADGVAALVAAVGDELWLQPIASAATVAVSIALPNS
jgi:hypothetical protein